MHTTHVLNLCNSIGAKDVPLETRFIVCVGEKVLNPSILSPCRNILELVEFFEEEDKFYLVFEKLRGGTEIP